VTGIFAGHPLGGELAQLIVDEREKVGGGLAVTGRGRIEEPGYIGHSAECNRAVAAGNAKAANLSSVESPDGYGIDARGRSGKEPYEVDLRKIYS
jgi:hypothetical protein